jgi:adenosine kinase
MTAPRTLVCGSLAFDTIMVFRDRFGRHILPDRTQMLSVSFTVGDLRREWGGCAGNIAYNLKGLGGAPVVMATIGDDGAPYRERLEGLGIATEGLRTIGGTYTAQAYIITDLDDNQITAFHPGAMQQSHENRVGDVAGVALGIVAPDGRDGMLAHAEGFRRAKVPFVFDPGQALTLFSGDELEQMVDGAAVVAVNDYEGQLLAERLGTPLEALARRVEALVVTHGAKGSSIHVGGATIHVPAVRPSALVDPTGCGDAYRAGLLYGMAHGWDWQQTGRLASVMGALKIAARGGQNHAVTREAVDALFAQHFGGSPW